MTAPGSAPNLERRARIARRQALNAYRRFLREKKRAEFVPLARIELRNMSKYNPNECSNENANARRRRKAGYYEAE